MPAARQPLLSHWLERRVCQACCLCACIPRATAALLPLRAQRTRDCSSSPPTPRGAALANGPLAACSHVTRSAASRSAPSEQLTCSRPSAASLANARRLRPAGQRPASRRLSRSPSAPERTLPFFIAEGGEERKFFLAPKRPWLSHKTAGRPSAPSPRFASGPPPFALHFLRVTGLRAATNCPFVGQAFKRRNPDELTAFSCCAVRTLRSSGICC